VATGVGIEKTEGSDSAPAPGEVEGVDMRKGDRKWAKVEGGGSKGRDLAEKIAPESGVIIVREGVEREAVKGMYGRVPGLEKT
jgi:hypothetical protein